MTLEILRPLRIISISRRKSEGRPEGAKRPTAGDEPREFTSRGEGGRVPPFFEKLRRRKLTVEFIVMSYGERSDEAIFWKEADCFTLSALTVFEKGLPVKLLQSQNLEV